jgi:hypothetical protein
VSGPQHGFELVNLRDDTILVRCASHLEQGATAWFEDAFAAIGALGEPWGDIRVLGRSGATPALGPLASVLGSAPPPRASVASRTSRSVVGWTLGPHPYTSDEVATLDVRLDLERWHEIGVDRWTALVEDLLVRLSPRWLFSELTNLHLAQNSPGLANGSAFGVDLGRFASAPPGREWNLGAERFGAAWMTWHSDAFEARLEFDARPAVEASTAIAGGPLYRLSADPAFGLTEAGLERQQAFSNVVGYREFAHAHRKVWGYWQRT